MDDPYLTTQLIAYIGNKRALLPFLRDVFTELDSVHPVCSFGDLFSGSGSVSRLGKYLGFATLSNDWETYSFIINSCHIGIEKREEETLFREYGGVKEIIDYLHNLPAAEDGYIARNYAPRSTLHADYRKERLFYTRENAVFIDTVREGIESLYPGRELSPSESKEKNLLIASLLYQAATHANTSGVFKAYHKGFGGYGGDALSRIFRPMKLQVPVLMDGKRASKVLCRDAVSAAGEERLDLCYLDPPYNQHQYGSNYHLLNSIARWDKQPQPIALSESGRMKNKGGIRRDWTRTRSDFCYKEKALPAFADLLDAIDSRYIVLSYNTEGIMEYEAILDALDTRGKVDVYSSEYVKYRGGRQSNVRKNHNVEYLLVCSTREVRSPEGRAKALRFVLENKLRMLMRNSFYPDKIRETFSASAGRVSIAVNGSHRLYVPMTGYLFFTDVPSREELNTFSSEELKAVYERLLGCLIENKYRECRVILRILQTDGGHSVKETRSYERIFLRSLKKIAHKKYRTEYFDILERIAPGDLKYTRDELNRLREIAGKRFSG